MSRTRPTPGRKAPRIALRLAVLAAAWVLGGRVAAAQDPDSGSGAGAELASPLACVIHHSGSHWMVHTFNGTETTDTDPRQAWEAKWQAATHYQGSVLVALDEESWIPCPMIQEAQASPAAAAFITPLGILTGDAGAYRRYVLVSGAIARGSRHRTPATPPPAPKPPTLDAIADALHGTDHAVIAGTFDPGRWDMKDQPLDVKVVGEYERLSAEAAKPKWVKTNSGATISVTNAAP